LWTLASNKKSFSISSSSTSQVHFILGLHLFLIPSVVAVTIFSGILLLFPFQYILTILIWEILSHFLSLSLFVHTLQVSCAINVSFSLPLEYSDLSLCYCSPAKSAVWDLLLLAYMSPTTVSINIQLTLCSNMDLGATERQLCHSVTCRRTMWAKPSLLYPQNGNAVPFD
jgi:hypothetical protein